MLGPLEPQDVPRLARRARLRFDRRSGCHLLLCPERGLILNPSAAAIVRACSGTRSVADIASFVAAGTSDGNLVLEDTLTLLGALRQRRLIALSGEQW
jgi:pyrroloquinoline quinone biosynthesis protein D